MRLHCDATNAAEENLTLCVERGGRRGRAALLFLREKTPRAQPCIHAAACEQIIVRATLDDASALQHENEIRVPYGRKPVRDHE